MMPGKEVVKKVKSMFFSSYMNSCIEKGENKETCELNFFFFGYRKESKNTASGNTVCKCFYMNFG